MVLECASMKHGSLASCATQGPGAKTKSWVVWVGVISCHCFLFVRFWLCQL